MAERFTRAHQQYEPGTVLSLDAKQIQGVEGDECEATVIQGHNKDKGSTRYKNAPTICVKVSQFGKLRTHWVSSAAVLKVVKCASAEQRTAEDSQPRSGKKSRPGPHQPRSRKYRCPPLWEGRCKCDATPLTTIDEVDYPGVCICRDCDRVKTVGLSRSDNQPWPPVLNSTLWEARSCQHGWGLFARRFVPAGARIPYLGVILECRMVADWLRTQGLATHMLTSGIAGQGNRVWDGRAVGEAGMQHSNVKLHEHSWRCVEANVGRPDKSSLWYVTTVDLQKGDQVFNSYGQKRDIFTAFAIPQDSRVKRTEDWRSERIKPGAPSVLLKKTAGVPISAADRANRRLEDYTVMPIAELTLESDRCYFFRTDWISPIGTLQSPQQQLRIGDIVEFELKSTISDIPKFRGLTAPMFRMLPQQCQMVLMRHSNPCHGSNRSNSSYPVTIVKRSSKSFASTKDTRQMEGDMGMIWPQSERGQAFRLEDRDDENIFGDSSSDRQAVATMNPATATENVIEGFQSLLQAVRAAIDGRQQFRDLKEKASDDDWTAVQFGRIGGLVRSGCEELLSSLDLSKTKGLRRQSNMVCFC